MTKSIVLSCLLLILPTAYADVPNLDLLKKKYGTQGVTAKKIDMSNVYEIKINNEIAYLSEDGKYILVGDLIDIESNLNLTEESRKLSRKELMSEIPDADKIVFKADNEKYVIDVFTDYTCPYCVKLHQEIPELNRRGITVRYLAFPRSGPQTEVADNMQAIWCSADAKAAFDRIMLDKKIPSNSCDANDNRVYKHFELALSIGVNSTPSIVLSDGTLSPGYRSARELAQLLEGGKRPSQ